MGYIYLIVGLVFSKRLKEKQGRRLTAAPVFYNDTLSKGLGVVFKLGSYLNYLAKVGKGALLVCHYPNREA